MRPPGRQTSPSNFPLGLFRRLTNPQDVSAALCTAGLLWLGEAVLCTAVIWRIPYTEIDWIAYMDQVEGFLEGERDYTALKGPTGPLVYPAGFVYLYTVLHWLSGGGKLLPAQYIFAGLYLTTQAIVLWLYVRSKAVPPLALVLLCASKRMHSIFLLRLFNDGPAMLLAYAAAALLTLHWWRAAILCFSAAVSIKMNVLLMAPSVLVVVLKGGTPADLVKGTVAGVVLQLMLGLPFLLHSPGAYLSRAFELSRVFLHVWSVNLKFLPEHVFQSKGLAAGLLLAHGIVLWLFARYQWCKPEGGLAQVISSFWQRQEPPRAAVQSHRVATRSSKEAQGRQRDAFAKPGSTRLRAEHILLVLFSGNFIGIVFSRTLHYQFYAWYFHTIPFLLWQVQMHWIVRVGLWFGIELVWNVYPSTATSSLSLLACHLCVMVGLWLGPKAIKPYEKVA